MQGDLGRWVSFQTSNSLQGTKQKLAENCRKKTTKILPGSANIIPSSAGMCAPRAGVCARRWAWHLHILCHPPLDTTRHQDRRESGRGGTQRNRVSPSSACKSACIGVQGRHGPVGCREAGDGCVAAAQGGCDNCGEEWTNVELGRLVSFLLPKLRVIWSMLGCRAPLGRR